MNCLSPGIQLLKCLHLHQSLTLNYNIVVQLELRVVYLLNPTPLWWIIIKGKIPLCI